MPETLVGRCPIFAGFYISLYPKNGGDQRQEHHILALSGESAMSVNDTDKV